MKRIIVIFFMLLVLLPTEAKADAAYLELRIFVYTPSGAGSSPHACSTAKNVSDANRYTTNYLFSYDKSWKQVGQDGHEVALTPRESVSSELFYNDFYRYKAVSYIYNSVQPQSGYVDTKTDYLNWYY